MWVGSFSRSTLATQLMRIPPITQFCLLCALVPFAVTVSGYAPRTLRLFKYCFQLPVGRNAGGRDIDLRVNILQGALTRMV